MAPDLETMVRELFDREQIGRLPRQYAQGVDRRNWDLVASCFAAHAEVHGSRKSAPIAEYLVDLRSGVEYFPTTMHFMGSPLIDLEGDAASMETYAVAFHWKSQPAGTDTDGSLIMGVRYHDEVARVDGHWLITSRKVDADWRFGTLPPQ